MMKKIKLFSGKIAGALLATILYFPVAMAQESQVVASESKMEVFGTSNIHDWELKAGSFHGKGTFTMEENQLKSVEKLSFTLTVEELKSGKSGMDKNTYKALKSKEHKQITFRSGTSTGIKEAGAGKYEVNISGDLTIAGVTKNVPLKLTVVSGAKVHVSGSTDIVMTDYGIEPPTALLGTVKTGEKVTVKFEMTYK
ncbi:YceI family protein [Sinomicrobium oceani]|nr:YceI family protein [Sinomicrobium oceani]